MYIFPMNSIPPHIFSKIGKNLHLQAHHPIHLIYQKISKLFPDFKIVDNLSPIVSTQDNFDLLRIPADHPSRRTSDTYYVDAQRVLRTHTSAHQIELLRAKHHSFLVCGDVYRKDSIDATHYPVFHQLEGVHLCSDLETSLSEAQHSLKETLSKVIKELFDAEFRFKEDFFPFTHPSWEVEVNFEGEWLEVLGCGIIHPEVLDNADIKNKTGWAFGLGLERLAMILYKIPDIRYFWSEDPRFLNQFTSTEKKIIFQPYSKCPPCFKDTAFWISETFNENEMMDVIRNIGGNLIESVVLFDTFQDLKHHRTSRCYRITFRDFDRTLTNQEINIVNNRIRSKIAEEFQVTLR